MKTESTLSKKLASYSALASALLMVNKMADAQILYTDVNPDDIVNAPSSYLLDLNNDGTTDFQFNLIQSTVTFGTSVTYINELMRVVANGSNSVVRDAQLPYAGYYYASVLYAGNIINGSLTFGNQAILASYFYGGYFGNWVNVADAFLGLKLVVNSNTYYGWARLSVNQGANQLTVIDYAVDTIAEEAIAAGEKCGNYAFYATTVINPSDSITLCEGSVIILTTDSLGGFTYQWLVDSTVIVGANTFSYPVDSSGNYNVMVTNPYGCVDVATGTQVTLLPAPAIPVISQDVDTLISSTAISYQWYFNSILIPGATDQTFTASLEGDYTVQITDANGCTSVSAPYAFVPTGVSPTKDTGVSVFEANNVVFVQLNDKKFLSGQIKIWNALGDNVYTSIVNTETFQIDLDHVPAGVYLLTIEKSNENIARKIVIK